jgi:DNA segregation ATPase FtsK/SpoIIIE, S-DNA-T family
MNIWSKLKARNNLIKTFRSAGIYKVIGSDERKIFPKIHSVKIGYNATEMIFTLLNGMDPKETLKKEFVFKQYFGENIKLDGEIKKFVLTIYNRSFPNELKYVPKAIDEQVIKHKLGIICGMDRNGQYVSLDLITKPHILIAGETGSGKSTQLRSILTTLIRNKKPSELQLYLGDCKKSEFHVFKKVEHVQCVLSKPKDIGQMLKRIKRELDERSDLTETFEVSHVDDLPAEQRRPYIIVCIDEFVMLRKDETIMDILTEIVAIGRTLGVFAILSMQRPNAKVLDTTIRVNLTVSMGFKLRDKMESRIVNTHGADEIEKSGRFIMNSNKLYELQAPYLELEDAKKILNPFYVTKSHVKEIIEDQQVQPKLTESDVFNDVN